MCPGLEVCQLGFLLSEGDLVAMEKRYAARKELILPALTDVAVAEVHGLFPDPERVIVPVPQGRRGERSRLQLHFK